LDQLGFDRQARVASRRAGAAGNVAFLFAAQCFDQQQQLVNLRPESAILRGQLFIGRLDVSRHRFIVLSTSRRAHIGSTTRIQLAD
jgi:hypothetical protein